MRVPCRFSTGWRPYHRDFVSFGSVAYFRPFGRLPSREAERTFGSEDRGAKIGVLPTPIGELFRPSAPINQPGCANIRQGVQIGVAVECWIRPAQREDAEGISRHRLGPKKDQREGYPEAVIARVERNFSPAAVSDLLARRLVLVAVKERTIVGTASLDGGVVRTVFIDPGCQGRGIGRALMVEIERAAIEKGVAVLAVPSSVTAEPFYAKLGFKSMRDSFHGEERTIVMERALPQLSQTGEDQTQCQHGQGD